MNWFDTTPLRGPRRAIRARPRRGVGWCKYCFAEAGEWCKEGCIAQDPYDWRN